MNQEHQLSIGYTYYIKGTTDIVEPTPNVEVTLKRFDNYIDLSNYLDNYGTYTYTFNVNDNNFNSLSTSVNFDIYIAKLTTSKSLDHDTNDGTAYTSLDDAIKDSKYVTSQSYIYVYGDAVIGEKDSTLTLEANTELYLPYSSTEGYEVYNESTGLNDSSLEQENVLNKYLTITINEGVTLTVEGQLTIGADRGRAKGETIQGITRSSYSEMIVNGDIKVYGTLWCAGYISGKGNIEAMAKSKVYEPFVITDWRGGTNAAGVYGGALGGGDDEVDNIVPFNQYQMHNISVNLKINYDVTYNGIASIRTNSPAQWNSTLYPLIGNGAILKLIDEKSYIVKSYDPSLDKTTLKLNGNIEDNPGQLIIEVPIFGDFPISTENLFFGISHNVKIVVANASTLKLKYKYKMLPGSELIIEENATLNLEGKLTIYKDWVDEPYLNSNGSVGYDNAIYPTGLPDGYITNKGKLKVIGSIAGDLYNIDNLEGAILDLSNAKSLQIETKEGYNNASSSVLLGKIIATYHETLNANCNGTNLENKLYAWNGSSWDLQA